MSISTHSRRTKRMAIGLFLTTALSSVVAITPALAHDPQKQALNVWAASKYGYCDVILIGKLWKTDLGETKSLIGQKILNGIGSNVSDALKDSRAEGNQCEWGDVPYSYEDAAQIAKIWELSRGVGEAKSKMAMLATAGKGHWIDAALSR